MYIKHYTVDEIHARKDEALTMAVLCGIVFIVILLACLEVANMLGALLVLSPIGVFVGLYEYHDWSKTEKKELKYLKENGEQSKEEGV